jgi:hypothetical protein
MDSAARTQANQGPLGPPPEAWLPSSAIILSTWYDFSAAGRRGPLDHCPASRLSFLREVAQAPASTTPCAVGRRHGQEGHAQLETTHVSKSLGRADIVDKHLGLSAASTVEGNGFARLTAEVALRHVGKCSRFGSVWARNNADWYRQLDLCGTTTTPIVVTQRCLTTLGAWLKASMSDAELHGLRLAAACVAASHGSADVETVTSGCECQAAANAAVRVPSFCTPATRYQAEADHGRSAQWPLRCRACKTKPNAQAGLSCCWRRNPSCLSRSRG